MIFLVVDDSKTMRMIVRRTLRQTGFPDVVVKEADNGVLGLAAIVESPPDIVLSDWNMPEMNGIEFLKELRKTGSQVPFGFVTSEGTPEMRALAVAEGACFFITKPFTADSFKDALHEVLA